MSSTTKRWLWFFGLYASAILAVGGFHYLIRWLIHCYA